MQNWNVYINNRDVVIVVAQNPEDAIDYIYETRSYDIWHICCDNICY